MGLLSGFTNFVEHPIQGLLGAFRQPTDGGAYFDQNGQLIGNGGDASRPYVGQGGPAPMPPQLAGAPQRQPGFLSSLAKLPGAYVNDLLNDMQAGPRATQEAATLRQQIEQEASQTGLTPEQLLILHTNPKALGQALSTHGTDVVLNQGAVRNRGGVNIAGAPVIGAAGDRVRSTDPITGETDFSQARPPTFAEQTTRAAEEQAAANAMAMEKYRQEQTAIARQRLGVQAGHYGSQDSIARQREGRLRSGGSSGGGGAPASNSSATLDAIAAELKRRGKL